jgi:hypothetical protein
MFDSLKDSGDQVSWRYDGETRSISKQGGPPVATDSQRGWLFIVLDGEQQENSLLVVDESGAIVHRLSAATPFRFYYLTTTKAGEVLIVCTTYPAIDGFTDWHFQLVADGTLRRGAPAY